MADFNSLDFNSLEDFLKNYEKNQNQKLQIDNNNKPPVEIFKKQEPIQQPTQQQIQSTDLFYHLILDCDFPNRDKIGDDFVGKYTGTIKGFLKESGRVPVLFDINDAKIVASKLLKYIMDKGTTKGKRFPVFGIMALGFKAKNLSIEKSVTDIAQTGAKDYKLMTNVSRSAESDMVTYNVKGFKRGLVLPKVFKNATLVSASYCHPIEVSLPVGLSLLNMLPHFTEDDIKLVKQIYDKHGDYHMLAVAPKPQNVTFATNPVATNHIENSIIETTTSPNILSSEKPTGENHVGGQYKKLYKLEKEKYVHLRSLAESKGILPKKH